VERTRKQKSDRQSPAFAIRPLKIDKKRFGAAGCLDPDHSRREYVVANLANLPTSQFPLRVKSCDFNAMQLASELHLPSSRKSESIGCSKFTGRQNGKK
jgi:hypothetical protein